MLSVPSLDLCGTFEPHGEVKSAAWAPSTCVAAVTVLRWLAGQYGLSTTLYLVSCTGAALSSAEFDVSMDDCAPSHGNFEFSPDGSLLAALLFMPAGKLLCLVEAQTLSTVANIELEPAFASLKCPDSTQWGIDNRRPSRSALCWQWLPCSARLVVWAMLTWHWDDPEDAHPPDELVYQKLCAAFLATLAPGNLQLMEMRFRACSDHVQDPKWGLGGLAAQESDSCAVLLVPGSVAYAGPSDQLVFAWPDLEPAAAASEGLTRILPELSVLGPWVSSGFFTSYAWSPTTVFVAVLMCEAGAEDPNSYDSLRLLFVDGRNGRIRAVCKVKWQHAAGSMLVWAHLQWSPSGSALCVSTAEHWYTRQKRLSKHRVQKSVIAFKAG